MSDQSTPRRAARAARAAKVAAPFPALAPVQREQLAAWLEATASGWDAAVRATRAWTRANPDDDTMAHQLAYYVALRGAWRQLAYLVRVTAARGGTQKKGG